MRCSIIANQTITSQTKNDVDLKTISKTLIALSSIIGPEINKNQETVPAI